MSQSGHITLYSEDKSALSLDIGRIIDIFGPRSLIENCMKIDGCDNEWDAFKKNIAAKDPVNVSIPDDLSKLHPEEDNTTYIFELDFHNELTQSIVRRINRDIPSEIRGNYEPWDTKIYYGWHDICEWAEHEKGYLFGRAAVSASLWGYGTPNDWNEYRRMAGGLPEILNLKKVLQKIIGKMNLCMYWSI